ADKRLVLVDPETLPRLDLFWIYYSRVELIVQYVTLIFQKIFLPLPDRVNFMRAAGQLPAANLKNHFRNFQMQKKY
ncbi:MAG: hypothetical protein K6U74_10435, partial [Firmicutes bacterium]|nr:hypothetical protein [Bacillota bacterium]